MRIDISNNAGVCGVVPTCAEWSIVAISGTKLFDKTATNSTGLSTEEVSNYCCSAGPGGGIPVCDSAAGCGYVVCSSPAAALGLVGCLATALHACLPTHGGACRPMMARLRAVTCSVHHGADCVSPQGDGANLLGADPGLDGLQFYVVSRRRQRAGA